MAARLPLGWRQCLKRWYFAGKIRCGCFTSEEGEYWRLNQWISPGDSVLDVGANVGCYAVRMSWLVGPTGRVFAFEPVRESFDLLVANARFCRFSNMTLLNVAVSDRPGAVNFCVPQWEDGGENYYEARITNEANGFSVYALPVDALNIPLRVSLAKIDTEGHELAVLKGMRTLIQRDHPVLIVEANSASVIEFLAEFGYAPEREAGSANYVFRAKSE